MNWPQSLFHAWLDSLHTWYWRGCGWYALVRLTWDEDSYKIFDPSRVPDGTVDIPKQVQTIPLPWSIFNCSMLSLSFLQLNFSLSLPTMFSFEIMPTTVPHSPTRPTTVLCLTGQPSSHIYIYIRHIKCKKVFEQLFLSEFVVFDHPRYGVIPCIASIHSIAAGEEVFVR